MKKEHLKIKIRQYKDNDNFPEVIKDVIFDSLEAEDNMENLEEILSFFNKNDDLVNRLK